MISLNVAKSVSNLVLDRDGESKVRWTSLDMI